MYVIEWPGGEVLHCARVYSEVCNAMYADVGSGSTTELDMAVFKPLDAWVVR